MRNKLPIAVTFDCWQTLLIETDGSRPRKARVDALAACTANAGRPLSEEGAQDVITRVWRRHEQTWQKVQVAGALEMANWCLEDLGFSQNEIETHVPGLIKEFEEASLLGDARAIEGAEETLLRLSENGVRRALICDTGFSPGRVVRQLLDRANLLTHLEVFSFSDEVRVPKPHRRMFETVLEALGIAAADAVHIGDLRRTDIAGAKQMGMTTVRLRQTNDDRSNHPEADQVVDSHADFREWLGLETSPGPRND